MPREETAAAKASSDGNMWGSWYKLRVSLMHDRYQYNTFWRCDNMASAASETATTKQTILKQILAQQFTDPRKFYALQENLQRLKFHLVTEEKTKCTKNVHRSTINRWEEHFYRNKWIPQLWRPAWLWKNNEWESKSKREANLRLLFGLLFHRHQRTVHRECERPVPVKKKA